MSQLQQDSHTLPSGSLEVWVLREAFLGYERFHGVFTTKKAAKAQLVGPNQKWTTVTRNLASYAWDELDPFNSDPRSEVCKLDTSTWVVEPLKVQGD